VIAVAAHPGYAATNLQASVEESGFIGRTFATLGQALMAQSATAGTQPTLYAALADVPGGAFIGPDGIGQVRGAPQIVAPNARARDVDVAKRLWQVSEELTGTQFPL